MGTDSLGWPDKDSEDQFYHWVGRSVSNWATVDQNLFDVFRGCMGGAPYMQLAIIYYRIPGLDPRVGLTDEIVRATLPRRQRKNGGHEHADVIRWARIKTRISDELAVRRQIAHQEPYVAIYTTEVDADGNPTENADYATAWHIYAGEHERMRVVGSVNVSDYPREGLYVADLKKHYEAVSQIAKDIEAFRIEVLPRHASTLPAPNLPQDPETVLADASTLAKAPPPQPEPSRPIPPKYRTRK